MSSIEQPHMVPADTYAFLSPLQITSEDFRHLAGGYETPQAATVLDLGTSLIHKMHLSYILTAVQGAQEIVTDASGEAADMPWDLLMRAEKNRPDTINTLLRLPAVGAWLQAAAEQLHSRSFTAESFAILSGEISALAAVAACQAKLNFTCRTVTRHGGLYLPTMGKAFVKEVAHEPVADVLLESKGDGLLRIRKDEKVVTLLGPNTETATWEGERHYSFTSSGRCLDIVLDDLTPSFYQEPTCRLTPDAAEDWRILLDQSWQLLARDYPRAAEELSRGLFAIKPLSPTGITKGATDPSSIGAAAIRKPHSKTTLAESLIHEYAHTKLTKLERFVGLFQPTAYEKSELLYAPWRDDPRPMPALLHGSYSFMHVAEFWRERRNDEGTEGSLAAFEYARWLTSARKGVEQLVGQPLLTENGRLFLRAMFEQLQSWPTNDLSKTSRTMAAAATVDHAALWRAHHMAVQDTTLLVKAVRAWGNGDGPPPGLWQIPVKVSPDTQGIHFRTRASLFRLAIVDPPLLRTPDAILPIGSLPADVWYVTGDTEQAEHDYLQILNQPQRSLIIRSLVGLGLVRRAQGDEQVAGPLLERPELILALMEHTGVKAKDIPDLTVWASQGRHDLPKDGSRAEPSG